MRSQPFVVRSGAIAQLVRFAFVGVLTNAALYIAYLALTALGVPYLVSMTVVYAAGVAVGFAMHRRFTFRDRNRWAPAAVRYVATYAGGYVLNATGLWWLVERWGLRHELSQAVMIVVVAGTLFLVQRAWVFSAPRR